MGYAAIGCECLIGLTFVLAALSKVRNGASFRAFVDAVRGLGIARNRAGRVAVAAVGAEAAVPVLLGIALAGSSALLVAGLVTALALLSAFTAVISVSMRRGDRVTCRCFGASGAPMGRRHIARNVLLSVAVLVALVSAVANPSAQIDAGGAVIAAAAGCLVALLVAFLDDIVDLFAVGPDVASR
ncbi:MauE/DoxX family redox-associated membrane protein [Actinomadura sp. WAC 06369]|uniref:MauE/DoxX family redox-associated membrane protein n=1 Tax=Actinomadura sp. WAC 06369 TaxID=2203193 RepID=UPI000F7B3CFC|nr:MauE/DoxX family redox-associated membrane protein [Actinomadura sp. WAC 06369]RSN71327.1 methylamine utilization protein MauE [Actinomadura sp. WAC 06369]